MHSGHRPGRRWSIALPLITCLIWGAAGCAGAAAPTISMAPSASAAESVSPTPTERPMLQTESAEADEAPAGAIDVQVGYGAKFVPERITARAGSVTFFLHSVPTNPFLHNFNIGKELYEPIAIGPTLSPRESVAFTVYDMEPGKYVFWCAVGTHAAEGMVGTLTVKP